MSRKYSYEKEEKICQKIRNSLTKLILLSQMGGLIRTFPIFNNAGGRGGLGSPNMQYHRRVYAMFVTPGNFSKNRERFRNKRPSGRCQEEVKTLLLSSHPFSQGLRPRHRAFRRPITLLPSRSRRRAHLALVSN